MIIKFLNGGVGRNLNATVMASALNAGKKLTCLNPYVSISVDTWEEFLTIVWNALSELSRSSPMAFETSRLGVRVAIDDGREFRTTVWYDSENRGLRYVSLYR